MKYLKWAFLLGIVIGLLPGIPPARAQGTPDHGAYLAEIAGCTFCHSLDESAAFAGGVIERNGQVFYGPNLTPSESGLGGWTDEDIRTAITTGLTPDGRQLHPVMPYLYYNGMAGADLDELIATLRALRPVESAPAPASDLSGVVLPPPPAARSGISVPPPDDEVAYGRYLTEAVLACGACHTLLLETGEPDPERWMAGGPEFRGEWGTAYAGNLTTDADGLDAWSDTEILLAIANGQHPDQRPLYAMPTAAYGALTGDDLEAVVAYLRSLLPILNGIPPAELNEGYDQYPAAEAQPGSLWGSWPTVVMLVLMGVAVIYMTVRQYRHAQSVREIDWADHFSRVMSEAREKEAQADEGEE